MLPKLLLPWFAEHAREMPWRETKDPYAIWLSEIMLQQTRVETVRSYYPRFMNALPNVYMLAEVEDDKLFKLWEGLGYYTRVKNIKKAAKVIVDTHQGKFPETYEEILALPGIGPYTAGAVASICFALPYPAVDGNVMRVWSRLLASDACIDDKHIVPQIADEISALFSEDIHPGTFNQALMELGATVCLPAGRPHCDRCPMNMECHANALGTQRSFPVRKEKKARKIHERTVFILQVGDEIAFEKVNGFGLLSGLWALPSVRMKIRERPAIEAAKSMGVDPVELVKCVEKKHVFSHIEWYMRAYYINCRTKDPQFSWAKADDLPLPIAYRKFLK